MVNIANVNVLFFLSHTHVYLDVQSTLKIIIFSYTYFYPLLFIIQIIKIYINIMIDYILDKRTL